MTKKSPPKDLLDWLGISDSPNWRVAHPLGKFISFLLALLIFCAFIAAFTLLIRTIQGGFDTAAGNLGAGALIVAILGAPFLVWGTVIKQTAVNFQKESHITDRISKAVEQLGAEKTVKKLNDEGQTVETSEPNIEVRIGGLLSLERIAQDSTEYDKGRDHVRVMEILCAYVRENAPATKAEPSPYTTEGSEKTLEDKLSNTPWSWLHSLKPPRSDIQVALFILGRRSEKQLAIEANHLEPNGEPFSLDLSKTNLQKANLENLNFANASFFKAQLQGAFCKGTDFSQTNLIYAQLTGLSGQNLNLNGAKLHATDVSYAHLNDARLQDCSISHTHMVRTQLKAAEIRFALKETPESVNRAYLIHCNLEGALIEGDAREVYFKFSLLSDEQFPRGLKAARLRNCILDDNFRFFTDPVSQSTFSPEELAVTFGDASTELKDASYRPAHWPDWELPYDGPNGFDTQWKRWLSDPDRYEPPKKPTR